MSTVSYQPSAAEVKALRDQTGAGMMDCKAALVEAGGDMDKAVEILRVKMGNKVGKLAGRETTEGTIQSYVHATGKVAAMVQVECNTDFVAKNEDFIAFARDVALHAVAASPLYVSEDDIPEEDKQREIRVFEQQLEAEGKPEHIRPKIIEGKLKAWYQQVVLLDQVHVNTDKHESKTIEQLRAELSSKTGENVVVKRFARFAIGE
jgi:elongation factor Ts